MKTTIKQKSGILTLLMAVFAVFATQAQQVVELTLEESLKYALENNVDAKNAQLEVLISKGIIGENRAAGLPQITGNLEFTKNLQPPLLILPAEAGGVIGGDDGPPGQGSSPGDITVIPFAVNYQSSLSINLEQMIFNGSYFVGLKAAKTLKSLTEYDKEKTEIDVIEATKKAFFTVLINKERKVLVSANLDRVKVLLQETEALYNEGFVEKLDVSRVKVQLNNIQTELDRIEAAEEISKQLLKLQIGMPLQLDIEVNQKILDIHSVDELETLLGNNGYRRVEIDQIKTNLDLTKLDMKNNQVQYIPNISAFGTFQRVTGAQAFNTILDTDRWFSTSFVGLRMNIPIFDGLNKSYRVQQNRVQIRQLENQQYFIEENIELEIFQAKTTLQNAIKTLNVQSENRELALEVFEMTKIKYQEGVGSNLEVVEADSALKEAETNYFSALYDALIAKVELEKALGIL
ncbi:TolC family protein [Mongoliibacter ruber]|uniref:Outer membrane protein TolC n=1 Tax=Mongoliibacter ruber TaxID=1750599 RepID=A0A2T0WGC4_9BACT|nr:TolC family protein [Mongoliibacter ruber]PRY85736.1 outer membrane protein TolC [Mongoliibacter ruber]